MIVRTQNDGYNAGPLSFAYERKMRFRYQAQNQVDLNLWQQRKWSSEEQQQQQQMPPQAVLCVP